MATQVQTAVADILKVSILGTDSIHVGFHLIPHIVATVLSECISSTYVIVTDTTLAKLHLPRLLNEFHEQLENGISSGRIKAAQTPRILDFAVSPGEEAKSRRIKETIEDFMLDKECTRDTVILALGGGVVGDLTGFVAATYMRGVRFIQIPTTLLAMVDSSIGGKTAIDTPQGKNFIGAFWQPVYVFVDLSFLETSSAREVRNGMAEVVKTAAIWKEDDFALLESHSQDILSAVLSPSRNSPNQGRFLSTRTSAQNLLMTVVTGSIYVKSHIVTIDERETGLRNLVNFGHTIGHAIEAVLTPKMLHGECVAVGMILEAEVSRQLGILSQVAVGRLIRTLQAYSLPVSIMDPRITILPTSRGLTVSKLLDKMSVDKKNVGKQKKVVLLQRIGKTYEEKASGVEDSVIANVLSQSIRIRKSIPRSPSSSQLNGHPNGIANGFPNGRVNGHSPLDSPAEGIVMVTPGSKSISNRALVLAALGKGKCRMRNLLHSDDTAVMMAALVDLKGAAFSWEDGGDTLVVDGGQGNLFPPANDKELYLGNAGTASRFLTAVCTLVQSPQPHHTVITGNPRMKQRPIGPLVDALRENGASVAYEEAQGSLPLKIGTGGLKGGLIKLAASVSSQYVSAVLLCAPYAESAVTLELTGGQVISQPYIDMTIAMMREFGIEVRRKVDEATGKLLDIYTVPKGHYINPEKYNVESDASSATYPLAIAAITGTTCTIDNIGSSSLQGDAGFAKNVLEPMGCTVTQTSTRTTVTGPPVGSLRALGEVDMETMTDAFLTASVLAAVATGEPFNGQATEPQGSNITKIKGIANQRVKECNRIKAMRDQLYKFGVKTDEFDDGIIVYGQPLNSLKSGASVHCYDDHRVAMSFSVLATVVEETVITERRCVEKTWPNWWDDLSRIIGVEIEGIDAPEVETERVSTDFETQEGVSDSTIFLIGMRGAGKTFIGKRAANALNRPFLDADDYFTEREGTVRAYVTQHGWPAFRATEVVHLKSLLAEKGTGYVISLGGGVVESPEARDLLQAHGGPVVHIVRELDEILQYLGEIGGSTAMRPKWGEPTSVVYQRRQPWFSACSKYTYVNYTGKPLFNTGEQADSVTQQPEIERFFRLISGRPRNFPHVDYSTATSFLSLTLPDVTPALSVLDELTAGVDAIELRVDLLSPSKQAPRQPTIPPTAFVIMQLAALRNHSTLPVIYSVRTAIQGGMFPDGAVDEYVNLVEAGISAGCEYVDVEMDMPDEAIKSLVNKKGYSRVIASWHDWSGKAKWNSELIRDTYRRCQTYGDVAKIVGTATDDYDNILLQQFVYEARKNLTAKPLLAINMGGPGQLTRILNPILTPVTHPALPVAAAPGQLSVSQIHTARHLIGKLPAKQYFLFGTPIQASLSPIIHNTGFKLLGLPHNYALHESAEVDTNLVRLMAQPDFGGASVTIPHKLAIMPHLTDISADAKAIGAVNTITVKNAPDGTRTLYGDNSDWKAIYLLAARRLPAEVQVDFESAGLVIGAGGTCRSAIYALHKLGLGKIYLYNRTAENAEKVSATFGREFGIQVVKNLQDFPGPHPIVIVSTVPGTSLTLNPLESGIHLSSSLLASTVGGVVIDMAYRPKETALIQLAQAHRASGWTTVVGVEILLEQAYVQFEGWTGKKAPQRLMRTAAMTKYDQA